MTELLGVMARLRDPDNGCPWDIKQSFETIAPYTIEEAYEVADAIQRRDMQGLKEELGDLLLQVVFHAQMACDEGLFDFEDVAQAIAQKMIERHPHVFGDLRFDSEADQKAHWEALKQKERESKSPQQISAVDGVALALPALTRAEKIQKRASRVGFDWSQAEDVVAKVDEEVAELRQAVAAADQSAMDDELGDLLFSVTNLARHLGVDPEMSLRKATDKFEARFKHMERSLGAEGRQVSSTESLELDDYWRKAKEALEGRN